MRLSKSKLWLLISILLAVLVTFLVIRYLSGLKPAQVSEPMTTVVVAKQKIPVATKITPEMVSTTKVPEKYKSPEAFTKVDEVINQFSTVDLYKDQTIIKGQVANANTNNELPYKIPEGKRAITIAVNALTGVAGHIKPGHFVDVLMNYNKDPDGKIEEQTTITLLQNILVLAVGPDLNKKEGVQAVENITLAVDPEDAQLIAVSEKTGSLKLILRPIEDDKKEISLPRMDFEKLEGMYP